MSQFYHDFQDEEKRNVFWAWNLDGPDLKYEPYHGDFMIAGDTDSAMMTLERHFSPDANIDDVVLFADDLGTLVNEGFPEFCMRAFNCPEDRKETVKTDREKVSDKSLFLTKKRYIMHVVDSEGKRVDELKIMGVELKKSDTSVIVKKMLRKVVDLILDDVSQETLLAQVRKFREEFPQVPPQEIATPISVKTLKRCEDAFAMTGDMKGFPYQVRAAMYWNSLCGTHDKRIMPGEKIGLLYIRRHESKYIGFPIDTVKFPDWFDSIPIDFQTEWDKAEKKIENYLTAIGWDYKSRVVAERNDLFGF